MKKNLNKQTAEIKICTWNIQTVNEKEDKIIGKIEEYKTQIMEVSNIRRVEVGTKLLPQGCTLNYSTK